MKKHCEKLRGVLFKLDKSKESDDMLKVINDLTKCVMMMTILRESGS
jgi:hypothetical protein